MHLLLVMFDVTFSICAWLGVVLVHAIVHISFGARRLLGESESHPLERTLVEEHPISPDGSRPVLVEDPSESSVWSSVSQCQTQSQDCHSHSHKDAFKVAFHNEVHLHLLEHNDNEKQQQETVTLTRPLCYEGDEEEESLDGDEPQLFFQLLSQTGSEMMNVSVQVDY
jgi:hypothetical protein